jgi:hypothetical protein
MYSDQMKRRRGNILPPVLMKSWFVVKFFIPLQSSHFSKLSLFMLLTLNFFRAEDMKYVVAGIGSQTFLGDDSVLAALETAPTSSLPMRSIKWQAHMLHRLSLVKRGSKMHQLDSHV